MRLNWSASASSSSPVWMRIFWSRLPSPMRRAPSSRIRIGCTMLRASASAASAEITSPASSKSPVRRTDVYTFSYTSCTGCSTNTLQASGSMAATEVSTSVPERSFESMASASGPFSSCAALTWGRFARSVLRSTRPMSGSAIRKPLRSTTYALPLSPILMRETTSQMNLRLTSATVTGPVSLPDRMAMVMYGSVSLRKYTGPNHGLPFLALRNAGSCERSLPELMMSMPRRETAICSRPLASSCAMSVTSGAWRSSFRNSIRRSSTSAASS